MPVRSRLVCNPQAHGAEGRRGDEEGIAMEVPV